MIVIGPSAVARKDGAAILRLAARIAADTGMPVILADSPLTCVAVGSGQALDHFDHVVKIAGVEHVGVGSDTDLSGRDRAGEPCLQS